MKFIKDSVPDITVLNEDGFVLEIKTMRYFDETEDRVTLKCAEFVKPFKRGFTCDLVTNYSIVDQSRENPETQTDCIKDLVLVHINKCFDMESIPQHEYIFFK
jgi:hypothetical protein